MGDRKRVRDLPPAYVDALKQCDYRVNGGEALPEAHHNGGSRLVAVVRYIAKPTIAEALFSYRRVA
jgi:hypothetical protein